MATTIRAMLNTDRESKSGLYPIVIRIIHNRQKKLVYTSHKIRREDFNPQSERIKYVEDNHFSKRQVKIMNQNIVTQKTELERSLELLTRTGVDFTVSDIVGHFKQSREDLYFFVFAQKEIKFKERQGKHGTASLYTSTINSFRNFGAKDRLKFKDITYSMLCDFAAYLTTKGIVRNSVNMYLRNLRSLYNKARRQGVHTGYQYPFTGLSINTLPTVKRALSKESIRKIANCDLSYNGTLESARDIFMFSFYSRGMSFVDMVFLQHCDISDGVIYYHRNKTQQNIQVAVTPQLQTIMDRYRSDSPFILPFVSTEDPRPLYTQYRRALFKTNQALKDVGRIIDIKTPLTTYVARHSWATVAKELGGSITEISEGLGHTTEKTTHIYLKSFDSCVINDLNTKVANFLLESTF